MAFPDARHGEPTVLVCGAVVLSGNGSVAMVRNQGTWRFPGGPVELGESIFAAAQREVFEETGLHVEPQRLAWVHERLGERREIFFTVTCDLHSGTLTTPHGDPKIDAAAWVPVSEAEKLVRPLPLRDIIDGLAFARYSTKRRMGTLAPMQVEVRQDVQAVASGVADYIEQWLDSTSGKVSLGLAGGGTPRPTYAELATRPIPWERIVCWLGDERWVAHDHPESNVGMIRASLTDLVGARLVAPNHALGDPAIAAAAYGRDLAAAFAECADGRGPHMVLLGIGDDGHTASLFPGTPALDETEHPFVANWVEAKDAWRLTATIPLLARAHRLVFIVTGESKGAMLRRILVDGEEVPARRVAEAAGGATWFVDAGAASQLPARI